MFTRMVVPLDGSPAAEQALPYATELARFTGACVVLVHTTDRFAEHEGLGSHAARAIIGGLAGDGDELVVMAACPHSVLHDTLTPSAANLVVASGRAPVLVIDPRAQLPVEPIRRLRRKRVIVVLDGSEFAQAGVPVAAQLARVMDGSLLVLHTVEFPPLPLACGASLQDPGAYWPLWQADLATEAAEASLEWTMEHLRDSFDGLDVATQLVMGDVAERLDPATGKADPIGVAVMATHVRKGLSRLLLGSPADDVFRRDHLPLLLVCPSASPTGCCAETIDPGPSARS